MPRNDQPSPDQLPAAPWLTAFRRRLRAWYARHARDLPWRRTSDPYRIWVSEIMLQQTQVATVKAYFERFTEAFPTIAALAQAPEQEVLRLWEGLGYYRRARQLHQAARLLAEQHGGQFPRDVGAVRCLPGIGRYTAGAILSIAFDARQPILEANTLRLFSRLLAYEGDPTSAAGSRLLWAMAEAVLPRRDVGHFNQALMELGSEVCAPRSPQCPACPVATLCRACAQGVQSRVPRPKSKPAPEDRHEAAILVRNHGRVLLLRCEEGRRWAGLWDFPRFLVHSEHPAAIERELCELLQKESGVVANLGRRLTTLKHGVTRFRITLDCYEAQYVAGPKGKLDPGRARWVSRNELADYPLSTTGRKLSRLVALG